MMTSSVRRLLALLGTIALVTGAIGARSEPKVTLVLQHPEPVITTRTSGAEGNRVRRRPCRESRRDVSPLHVGDDRQPDVGADATGLLDQPGSSALDARGDHPRIEC